MVNTYTIRRDIHGHAEAIERGGYTVLILATGAERNEREVEGVVAALNGRGAVIDTDDAAMVREALQRMPVGSIQFIAINAMNRLTAELAALKSDAATYAKVSADQAGEIETLRARDTWQPIETCLSDNSLVWVNDVLRGPTLREADGAFWRSCNKERGSPRFTHWIAVPRPLPMPPEDGT
jgi:hypothetical protein